MNITLAGKSILNRLLFAILSLIVLSAIVPDGTSAGNVPKIETPVSNPLLTPVNHAAAGATCGIGSGNFARTCRPGIHDRCMNAVARRVDGFTPERCARERDACSSCLKDMHACIGRIGHVMGYITNSTCDTCKSRASSCLESRSR